MTNRIGRIGRQVLAFADTQPGSALLILIALGVIASTFSDGLVLLLVATAAALAVRQTYLLDQPPTARDE